jgi:PKD repeat protein
MRIRVVVVPALLAGLVAAQSTLVIPAVARLVAGHDSSSLPFHVASGRLQQIYDSSHFTGSGVTSPIMIRQIRYRANEGIVPYSWSGSSATLRMDLSTAPFDYQAMTNTFASNHGADQTTVFNGPLSIPAGSTIPGALGSFFATVTFTTPFRYDPNAGDLTIETTHSGLAPTHVDPYHDAVTTPSVVFANSLWGAVGSANGTGSSFKMANVLEFIYTPATGLHAGFTADVTGGMSPLTVRFTSLSFSSAPGGITSWAWDFNGDNVVDSNLPNPTFVYGCGDFDVSLTVTDGTHPPATETKPAYIAADRIEALYSAVPIGASSFQFFDMTSPAPTSWSWDFNGDNIPDSFSPSPAWTFAPCQQSTVTLTATRNCQQDTYTRWLMAGPNGLTTAFNSLYGAGSSAMLFFDVNVTNPTGINICGFDNNTGWTFGAPFSIDVYVTPGTYVGKDANASAWRLVAHGAGITQGAASASALTSPLYLPPGSYGLAIHYPGTVRYGYTTGLPVVYSNADLTVRVGAARTALFGGTFRSPETWNGIIHYDTLATTATAGYGFFGAGCAGSLPVSRLQHTFRPQIGGAVVVNLDNLPQSAAIFLIGLSKTTSPLGALPLDLTAIGAPGCFGRVSPDVASILIGAGNTATWSLGVPNTAAFLGMLLYNQALVLDPGFNALGAVLSDATGMMVGN